MVKKLQIVRYVYFDTNILIRLPLTAPSPDFLKLKDLCNITGAKLFISELALKEYINYNQHEVATELSRIENSFRIIKDRVSSTLSPSLPKKEMLIRETEQIIRKRITDLGIEVFRVDIPFERVEELALKEISFKEKGKKKGLRDSIILLSILEHTKNYPEDLKIFIVDDIFFLSKEVRSMTELYNTNISIVKSLPEARDIIKKILYSIGKAIDEEREKRLKDFLESQHSKITDFIRIGQFNSFSLASGGPGESSIVGTIQKINAINYISIHSARPPQVYAKKEEKKVKISFMVKITFTIVVRSYDFPLGNQLQLEQANGELSGTQEQFLGITTVHNTDSFNDFGPGLGTILGQNTKEQTILRNISIEASAFLKLFDKETEEYSNLTLERLIT